jgi:hypothetical protein
VRRNAMPPSSRAAHRNFAFDFHHVFDGNRNAVQRADSMAGADCLTGSTPAPRCSMQSQKPEPDGRKRTHVNDVERLRLYRAQRELDGTLMLSRDNTRWLFNMAALGTNPVTSPTTSRKPQYSPLLQGRSSSGGTKSLTGDFLLSSSGCGT